MVNGLFEKTRAGGLRKSPKNYFNLDETNHDFDIILDLYDIMLERRVLGINVLIL